MVLAVRSLLGINLVFGAALAVLVWIAAPYAALHIVRSSTISIGECAASLRIASVLVLVRSIESVAVTAHRAFEQYRGTVQISVAIRLGTLASAAMLAVAGQRTVSILIITGVFLALGALIQFRQLRQVIGPVSLWPTFQPEETRELLGLGVFVWFQALGSVVFGQFDRILLGVSLGAQVGRALWAVCAVCASHLWNNCLRIAFLVPLSLWPRWCHLERSAETDAIQSIRMQPAAG